MRFCQVSVLVCRAGVFKIRRGCMFDGKNLWFLGVFKKTLKLIHMCLNYNEILLHLPALKRRVKYLYINI